MTQPDPTGRNTYLLKPGGNLTRHQSQIHINQLGFRGKEFALDKGDAFRFVALGESTTFGLTLMHDDRPWPEVLEERIAEHYQCASPVQVINAGVPGWTLASQLKRFDHDIVPLQPDVLLSYHGYNGFSNLFPLLALANVTKAPALPSRPSAIFGGLERVVRLWWYKRNHHFDQDAANAASSRAPLKTPYAQQYRELITRGRAMGAQVVLATFNMAVDAESPEEILRFYEQTVPDVRGRIIANLLHSRLVRELAQMEGLLSIDTSPGLDGRYKDFFIDVAHMNQPGRERLATHLLDGLAPVLEQLPRPGCRPRG